MVAGASLSSELPSESENSRSEALPRRVRAVVVVGTAGLDLAEGVDVVVGKGPADEGRTSASVVRGTGMRMVEACILEGVVSVS